ncbi:hypothetical protein D3C86_1861010 [compost metagenome]
MFEEFVPRFTAVEDAGVADVFRQLRWPRAIIVQFDGDQQRAIALLFTDATFHAMKLCWRGIADAEAFAGRHQPFAQLRIAWQVQIQTQGRFPGFPAP